MFNSKKEVIEALFAGKKLTCISHDGFFEWDNDSLFYTNGAGKKCQMSLRLDELFCAANESFYKVYTEPKQPKKIKLFRYTYWYAEKNITMQEQWTDQEPHRFAELLKTEEKEVEINE